MAENAQESVLFVRVRMSFNDPSTLCAFDRAVSRTIPIISACINPRPGPGTAPTGLSEEFLATFVDYLWQTANLEVERSRR